MLKPEFFQVANLIEELKFVIFPRFKPLLQIELQHDILVWTTFNSPQMYVLTERQRDETTCCSILTVAYQCAQLCAL